MTAIKANGHEIEITHPDKIIFADAGLTKMDLAAYYQKISDYILLYLEDRPMMLHRYPNGIGDKNFYQKEVPEYFPEWIDTIKVEVKKEGRDQQAFVNCNSQAALIYCVNQASITPHVWLSKKDKIRYPDKMIYDLDPPDAEFGVVRECAKDFRRLLKALDLDAFVMTTGSKGIHIVIPLDGKAEFDEVRQFAKDAAGLLADHKPDKYTVKTLKKKRSGRLFLDYLRNAYGQTAAAPYSLRARKGAPVATPLDWDEIDRSDLDSQTYDYSNIFRRLGHKKDPWEGFFNTQNNLEEARGKLDKMIAD